MLVLLRLVAPDSEPPLEATRALIVRALEAGDWDALVARFDATRQEVAQVWQSVSGGEDGGT
jgi:glutamate-ammonia-ligase adenylyltransferase